MITRLQSGHLEEGAANETENTIEKEALLVYPGTFMSMDGEVEITSDVLTRLADNHNSVLARVKRMATGEVPLRECPPIQLDHETKATHTVGRLIGPVEIKETELSDGTMVPALFGKIRVMGKENVEKVKDGRWIHLSIGADLESGKLNEVTITPFPAAQGAAMLSTPPFQFEYVSSLDWNTTGRHKKWQYVTADYKGQSVAGVWDSKRNKYIVVPLNKLDDLLDWAEKVQLSRMQERKDMKRYLAIRDGKPVATIHAASEDIARKQAEKYKAQDLKQLAEGDLDEGETIHIDIGSHNTEEETEMTFEEMKKRMEAYEKCKKRMMDKEKMSEEDAEKKLSEMPWDQACKMAEEHDEETAKMAEIEKDQEEKKEMRMAKLKAVTARLADAQKSQRLAKNTVNITARLSALRAQCKVTPAEIKGINLSEIAAKSEGEIEMFLAGFERRESPVIDPRALGTVRAENLATLQKKLEMTKLEEETRARFSSIPKKKKTKLSMDIDENTMQVQAEPVQEVQQGDKAKVEMGDLEIIHHMMTEGKHDEAMAKMKDYMAKMKMAASGDPTELGDHGDMAKHLSALVETEKLLQTTMDDVNKLIAEIDA